MATKQHQEFLLRPVALSDADAVTELINSFSQAFSGIIEQAPGEVEGFWKTPGIDLAEDIRMLYSPQDELIGYAEALAWNKVPVHPYIFLRMRPDMLESEGAAALLDWAVARCSQVLERVPADLRVSIGMHCLSGIAPLERLYTSRGFRVIRHLFEMGIDLKEAPPAPSWPQGIQLRQLDIEKHLKKIYLAHDDAFSDHFGHQEEDLETGLKRFRHLLTDEGAEYDPALWFIAMDGDEIAGYALCKRNSHYAEDSGWVTVLGVRRPWRKRGLGLALLQQAFGEFYRRGWRRAELDVDAGSLTGAVKLYERAGMRVLRRHDRYEKELRPGKELMTTELSD